MKIKRSLYYSRLIQRVKNMDHRIDHINNEIQKESPNGGEILNSYQGKAVNDAGQIRIDIPFDLLRMPLLPAASTTARVVCNADRHEDVQSADLAFAHLLKRERHRIARDLHDHVGQYIVGVMLRLAAIERRIEDADLRMELSELRPTLLRFTDELREDHRRIHEALLARDPDAARAAATVHVMRVERWLAEHLADRGETAGS